MNPLDIYTVKYHGVEWYVQLGNIPVLQPPTKPIRILWMRFVKVPVARATCETCVARGGVFRCAMLPDCAGSHVWGRLRKLRKKYRVFGGILELLEREEAGSERGNA